MILGEGEDAGTALMGSRRSGEVLVLLGLWCDGGKQKTGCGGPTAREISGLTTATEGKRPPTTEEDSGNVGQSDFLKGLVVLSIGGVRTIIVTIVAPIIATAIAIAAVGRRCIKRSQVC